MDYISRETAIELGYWHGEKPTADNPFPDGVDAVDTVDIENIPAADVREVVYCKDCRDSYEWTNVDGDKYRYCGYLRDRWNRDNDRMVNDDDFCKWGRKVEADHE